MWLYVVYILHIKGIGTFTECASLKQYICFFVIIGGFRRRLTKLLLNAVIAVFLRQNSMFQFKRSLLPMREVSTHQSLEGPSFVYGTLPGLTLTL